MSTDPHLQLLPKGDEPLAARVVVTAAQMQAIEARLFEGGIPVAALMEKVAGRIAAWVMQRFPLPRDRGLTVGIFVGPGHNGGDALVVARELFHRGYGVRLWCPFSRLKPLTDAHAAYARHLGIPWVESVAAIADCDVVIDGGFGFGLDRPIQGDLAAAIAQLNQGRAHRISIDLPSGLQTDSGEPLGIAVQAHQTLCLGLWKRGLLQAAALPWCGAVEVLPFDIPDRDIQAVLGDAPLTQGISAAAVRSRLPLGRSATAHKYTVGSLLVVAGSRQYAGAALLAGRGAIASGVGMVTLVVPERLHLTAVAQLPEALVHGAPETPTGAIAQLPTDLDLHRYDAIAAGPGLTQSVPNLLDPLLASDRPLILDADALNLLALQSPVDTLAARSGPTVLTPHLGEFRRLFPNILDGAADATAAAQEAAIAAGATVLLKGARTAIAHPDGQLWLNRHSTPALARGGSGDVLTGLIGGLAAQLCCQAQDRDPALALLDAAIAGTGWHAQAAIAIAQRETELSASPSRLVEQLRLSLGETTLPNHSP